MKQFMQQITRHAYLLFAAILISVNVTAFATGTFSPPDSLDKSLNVRHIGNVGNKMFFKVELENPSGEKFYILVKDQDGNVLFREHYSDRSFSKTFQLTNDEAQKVTFIIKTSKDTNTQSFEINTNTRVIDEVVVKKIN